MEVLILTQYRLKELFDYYEKTGEFTRIVTVSNNAMKGVVAGSINGDGYNCIEIGGKSYRRARLAWLYVYGVFPAQCIDHINGIRDDDRLENLRCVTHSQNMKNTKIPSRNTSGVIGVHWDKCRSKWRASIISEGKTIHLGRFDKKEDAAMARKVAEVEYDFHENHGAIRNTV